MPKISLNTGCAVKNISIGSGEIQIQPIERERELQDEFADLPLSDFEKNMNRLQKTEDEYKYASIIERLEHNYTQERETIYQSGYKAGIEAGRQESMQRCQTDLESLGNIINEIKDSRWRVRKEAELGMLNLVTQIARKILTADLRADQSKIMDIIREAIKTTNENEIITISLQPDDYEYVKENSELFDELPDTVQFTKDRTLNRGGCIINTNMETIDARIETKLEEIITELYMNITDEEE